MPDNNVYPETPTGSPAPTTTLAAELTPPQALAVDLDMDAARYRQQADLASRQLDKVTLNYAAGQSDGRIAAARDVMAKLAPKWDALTAGLDHAQAERDKAYRERDDERARFADSDRRNDAVCEKLARIRQACERPKDVVGETQGVVVNGESLARVILGIIGGQS